MQRIAGRARPGKSGGDASLGEIQPGVGLYAASLTTGRSLLARVDDFVRQQSRFDRQARLNLRFETVEVTQAIYLDYAVSQAMAWDADEIAALRTIVSGLARRFGAMDLGLPKNVHLVKTTGQEEGYAAYTRGLDTICLPANMVASLRTSTSYDDPLHPSDDLLYLEDVLNHECFHLFSKNNPARRRELYDAIHYRPTGNDVALPDIPWGPPGCGWTLPQLRITNPDGADLNVYIEMEVPEKPGRDAPTVRRALLPLLLASGPYDGGIFFRYLSWQFLALERDARGQWVPARERGKPLLYESGPLMEQYLNLVGRNITGEIFHPDEVLAQNFVLASKEPTPALLATMQRLMARPVRSGRRAH